MEKTSIDYNLLQKSMNKKKIYKLSDVSHRIEKIAFDVVRFTDNDNIDELWQIEHCADGDYIVALYQDSTSVKTASSIDWRALTDSDAVQIFYKETPIAKISLASVGIPTEDAKLVSKYLPKKLAENKQFVQKLINDLTIDEKQELYKKFPELV